MAARPLLRIASFGMCMGAAASAVVTQRSGCGEGIVYASSNKAHHHHKPHHDADGSSWCNEKTWGVPWISDWDNPVARGLHERNAVVGAASRAKRHIVLIRHGQYSGESSTKDDARRTLTELGKQQATVTGQYLKQLLSRESPSNEGEGFVASAIVEDAAPSGSQLLPVSRVDKVYVSNLTRARQTASLIVNELHSSRPEEVLLVGLKEKGSNAASRILVEDAMLQERFPCDPQPSFKSKKASKESMIVA